MSILMKRESSLFRESEDDQDVYSAKQIIFDQLTKISESYNNNPKAMNSFREDIDQLVDIVPEEEYGPYRLNGTPRIEPKAIVDDPNQVVYQMIDAPKQIKIAFRNTLQGILFELAHTECVSSLPALFDVNIDYTDDSLLGCIICKFNSSSGIVTEGLLDGFKRSLDNSLHGYLIHALSHGVEKDGEYWSEDVKNYNTIYGPAEAIGVYAILNPDKFAVTGMGIKNLAIYCGKLGMKDLSTKLNMYKMRIKDPRSPIMSEVELLESATLKSFIKEYKIPLYRIKDVYEREKASKKVVEVAKKVMKDYAKKSGLKLNYVVNDNDKFTDKIKYNPAQYTNNLTTDINEYNNYWPKSFTFLYVEGFDTRDEQDALASVIKDELEKAKLPYGMLYDILISTMSDQSGRILATTFDLSSPYKSGEEYRIKGTPI